MRGRNELDQLGDEGAGAGGGVENLHIAVVEMAVKVPAGEVVCGADHEFHNLARRIDHAEAVCGLGIVDLVEVLVNHLEKTLLFVVIGDAEGRPLNGGVVALEPVQGVAPHIAGEEGALQFVQPVGDVVFAVELVFAEDLEKDIPGEHVLDQHFAHIVRAHGGVDGPAAGAEKRIRCLAEARIALPLRADGFAQRFQHPGQILPELPHRLVKVGDLRRLVVQKGAQQPFQFCAIAHGDADDLAPALNQHGGLGILENDVPHRVALAPLCCDLPIQIVVRVLGLPVAAVLAQIVLHGAVGNDACGRRCRAAVAQFRRQGQAPLGAVALQVALECAANHPFAALAADPLQPGKLLPVFSVPRPTHRPDLSTAPHAPRRGGAGGVGWAA